MFNHPLIFLAMLGWAISRASAAVAGEIERGTLDLTLSRPVRRSTYLAAQIINMAVVFGLLGGATIAGHLVAPLIFRLNGAPGPTEFLPASAMLCGLGLAIFGYTLPFSARDLSRVRSGILGLGLTLGGIAALIFARQYEDYDWLSKLSIFEYYAPVGITVEWSARRRDDLLTLATVFGLGSILSIAIFLRRDLPTNSG